MSRHHEIIDRLEHERIRYTLYYSPEGFETVEKVCNTLSVEADQVLKTMIIFSRDKLFAFLVRGGKELDLDVVRMELQDEEARLARPDEMRGRIGMGPGEVSPLHPNLDGIEIFLDVDSTSFDEVIVGGGTKNHVFKVSLDDIVRILKPSYTSI